MKTFLILVLMMTPTLSFADKHELDSAKARYAQDRKLCADESTPDARMQCLRDAKAEYEKARAAENVREGHAAESKSVCAECGKVVSVKVEEKAGKSSPLGVIGGGVVGALLGNQVGQGTGRDVATIAGAAGGAYAGHKIEQNVKSSKLWTVTVHFENGDKQSFEFDHDPGFSEGEPVRKDGSSIVRR
ncbi:MAG: glycine zipper 2TM domain-containing protein [Burkholderiales bacterium]|nr:glycine zipper 2TM domain-containing protein [Burkholderiales bacterium]